MSKANPVINKAQALEQSRQYLRKIETNMEELLATASHVCLYYMASFETQQWAKKNVEGSLSLVKLKGNPRFKLIILNKNSTDNYSETVDSTFEYEINPPYLMYTHCGNSEIYGIWFFDKEELEKMGNLLAKIKQGLPKPDVAPPASLMNSVSQSTAHENGSRNAIQSSVATDSFWDKQVDMQTDTAAQASAESRFQVHTSMEAGTASTQRPVSQMSVEAFFKQAKSTSQAAPQLSTTFNSLSEEVKPSLLPPSFFSTSTPKEEPSTHLQKLFAKATVSTPASTRTSQVGQQILPSVPQSMLQAAPTPSTPVQSTPVAVREKVRVAFSKLLQNDAFVDMVAAEFKAAGLGL